MGSNRSQTELSQEVLQQCITEDVGGLRTFDSTRANIVEIAECLRQDMVVLVREVMPGDSDRLVRDVASALGLLDNLELQAGFADFLGHRHNIGNYFMSVNSRGGYQFVTPHSEGDRFSNMQMACFYCFENSTDGGETILFNTNESGTGWCSLRERVLRMKPGTKPLPMKDNKRVRALYRLNPSNDFLQEGDQVLGERATEIPGLTLLDVLTLPQKVYSSLRNTKTFAYWDTIGSIDHDSSREYSKLLRSCQLIKEPDHSFTVEDLDSCANRRIWSSGVKYSDIFARKITYKLRPREIMFMNNITWAHSVANWSPDSGVRNVAAAFC